MKYLERQKLWQCTFLVMLTVLALIAFWPSTVDGPVQGQLANVLTLLHTYGAPAWFDYKFVEASANVVLFIPLGIVAVLAGARKRWQEIGTIGLCVSVCMELGQLLFLHNRFASIMDVVTNTSGAVIGACLATAILKQLRARRLSAPSPKGTTETAS